MVGWAGAALGAVALALGAAPDGVGHGAALKPGAGKVCELRGSDRARTSSFHCIACHDGAVGPMVDFQMSATGDGMSHPVEVDYGASAARDPTHYRMPGGLPREIPLVNGKVACTTCHDGASPHPKHVVAVPRLCQSCHEM